MLNLTLLRTTVRVRRTGLRAFTNETYDAAIPKAERNPAHRSSIAKPPAKTPPVIDHPPTESEDYLHPEALPATVYVAPLPPAPVLPPPPPPPVYIQPQQTLHRPVGGLRGGLIGFLLGLSLAGGYGYVYLFKDYRTAASELLMSVDELKATQAYMTTHVKRIQSVQGELEQFKKDSARKKDLESLRAEYTKLVESNHVDLLNLKAHVWGVEQDLHSLTKAAGKEIRI